MKYKLLSTVFVFSFLSQTITAQDHKMLTNSRLILGTYKERTALFLVEILMEKAMLIFW